MRPRASSTRRSLYWPSAADGSCWKLGSEWQDFLQAKVRPTMAAGREFVNGKTSWRNASAATISSAHRPESPRLPSADHVNRADDEKSRNARKHRRFHYAQALCSVDAKIGNEHAVLLSRAERATARRMVSASVVANVVSQFIVGLKMLARQFLCSNETLLLQAGGFHCREIILRALACSSEFVFKSVTFLRFVVYCTPTEFCFLQASIPSPKSLHAVTAV